MKKRIFILVLATAMILALMPTTTALADDPDSHLPFAVTGGTYGTNWTYDWNGSYGTLHITFPPASSIKVEMKSGITQTADRIVIDDPGLGYMQHIVLKDVNIDVSDTFTACAVEVRPSYDSSGINSHLVTISCEGTNILKSGYGAPGIRVPENTLVYFDNDISSVSGSLEATGGASAPGIGGQPGENSGYLRFNSGSFTANGGSGAPGIGSGAGADTAGYLYMFGGSIYASGGDDAHDTGIVYLNSTSAQLFSRHDDCPWVNTTTHTHKTFTGVHAGDTVFGGVTLPWSGDYGAYLPLRAFAYDTNGGSGTTPDPIEQLVGTSTTITVAGSSGILREHYAFAGWNTHADGSGTAYTPGSSVPFTFNENITLYAQWTPIDYIITFDSREGSLVPTQYISISSLGSVVKPGDPTRDHYDFDDWYTETECENLYNFGAAVTSDLTLYAKWNPHQYDITYNLDGGVNNPGNPDTYTIESDEISLAAPAKTGCDFAGWSGTDVAGTSISVTIPEGSVGDRTYTAHWTPIITDLPTAYTMYTNGRITWDPKPDGGTWDWDETFFSATINSPATFTALKAGTSTITYSVGGASQGVIVTIRDSGLPSTGQDGTWILALSAAALVSLAAAMLIKRKRINAG